VVYARRVPRYGLTRDRPIPRLLVIYPPTKDRPDPKTNGADLIGRVFLEPEIGVCQITGIGLVLNHRIPSRAQVQRQTESIPTRRACPIPGSPLYHYVHANVLWGRSTNLPSMKSCIGYPQARYYGPLAILTRPMRPTSPSRHPPIFLLQYSIMSPLHATSHSQQTRTTIPLHNQSRG
jgi:hypothetical protein